jgi:7,8-dihydropterin-6-yl-methyl-4-(beta-D-ribofuranosyl)aminobenzene 5'-phosphate synthase
MKITIITDNYPLNPELKTEWGFSCLVDGFEKTILFDTGGDGAVLLNNIKSLGIDTGKIDTIFISHDHWDHTGGLESFLRENTNVNVYILPSFSKILKNSIKEYGANIIENQKPGKICTGIYTTGTLDTGIKEQSLVIETKKGLYIITGCAHPGIVHIISTTKENLNQTIYLVLGGFHLSGYSDSDLKEIIKQFRKLGVEKAGPCHCSGERCRELFAEDYKENFVNIGVGKVINIE